MLSMFSRVPQAVECLPPTDAQLVPLHTEERAPIASSLLWTDTPIAVLVVRCARDSAIT